MFLSLFRLSLFSVMQFIATVRQCDYFASICNMGYSYFLFPFHGDFNSQTRICSNIFIFLFIREGTEIFFSLISCFLLITIHKKTPTHLMTYQYIGLKSRKNFFIFSLSGTHFWIVFCYILYHRCMRKYCEKIFRKSIKPRYISIYSDQNRYWLTDA